MNSILSKTFSTCSTELLFLIVVISSLNTNKSINPMDVRVFQLKFCTFFMIQYQTILQLFVTYLSLEVSSYRPISLLSNIDEIIEKLIHSRLTEFLGNSLIQIVWVQKQFLHKPCHLNFARKHTESTRWRTICMRDFYRPRKSIWHCKSWYISRKTKPLWYKRYFKWLFHFVSNW